MEKTRLTIIIEQGDGEFWGRLEDQHGFHPSTVADTVSGVIDNLKDLIGDYIRHEGQKSKFWKGLKIEQLTFDLRYDLQAFFQDHDYLKISAIAKRANMNPGLLRQYVAGVKHPSAEQAKRIEDAIHHLAEELGFVSLFVA